MRVSVISKIHSRIKPSSEQPDAQRPVCGIELDLVHETRRFPVMSCHSDQQPVSHIRAVSCGDELSEHRQIVEPQRDSTRGSRAGYRSNASQCEHRAGTKEPPTR
jgi:hypothetical protein